MELPFDQNLGFAWAVPYKNVATFQIGCKGYIQLALRTGQYKSLNARDVRAGELSGRDYIGDPIINWLPDEERENKQIIGYMAGLELVNGFKKIIYWSTSEIEKHANRYSQSYKRNSRFNNVWSSNFDKMAEKTLIKALISRYGILSTDMQRAVQSDHSKINIDFETGTETIDYFDNPTTNVGLTTEQQAELLKTYGAEKVSKALENLKIDSLNQVQFDELEDFKKSVSEVTI
ncbi:hypothetical protein FACS189465_3670 [Clostridia bacterium]|nr:hypothetical protein FACS189465_3670 [Clostridia bacterium]